MTGIDSRRAVFLDRDGVLNEVVLRDNRPESPRCLAEFRLFDNLNRPLHRLCETGFRLFVVTNQPDLARQLLTDKTLFACNKIILDALPIEGIRVCPHDSRDACFCRKPKPGMLADLAFTEQINLAGSYMIGDTWKDSLAARAAGCISLILDRTYNREDPADLRVADMAEAVDVILGREAQLECSPKTQPI